MKMLKFRVQNYKKTEDSGWIHTGKITAFVGKNEAGKSAIFKGLSKLNPSDNSTYDGLKEFPRRRYTDEFDNEDWPVSSAKFELDDDKLEISEINPSFSKITNVVVTRYYDNKYNISYDPKFSKFYLSNADFTSMLKDWKNKVERSRAPDGKGEELQPIKLNLISIIDQQINSTEPLHSWEYTSDKIISEFFSKINSHVTEDWQESIFKTIIDDISSLVDKSEINPQLDSLFKWVLKNMPEFIYFDRYDILDSAIHIDDFIRILNMNDQMIPH